MRSCSSRHLPESFPGRHASEGNDVCALCLLERPLCDSHVIPRWAVKLLKPDGLSFYSLDGGSQPRVGIKQDAVKEPLLCEKCEERTNQWDDPVRDLLVASEGMVWPSPGATAVGRTRYETFKLFQLSVLWQAHEARAPFFQDVDLGPSHGERLRRLLLTGDPGRPSNYPCGLLVLHLDGDRRADFIDIIRVQQDGHHIYALIEPLIQAPARRYGAATRRCVPCGGLRDARHPPCRHRRPRSVRAESRQRRAGAGIAGDASGETSTTSVTLSRMSEIKPRGALLEL